jgi:DNA-binding transcriptional regulator LsrR (DeoR family)
MQGEVFNQSTWVALKAADLYYKQNKSQKEISEILQVSTSTVSRLLKRAAKENIVSFVIQEPYAECLDLKRKLKSKYGLKEVIVVPPINDPEDKEAVKQTVALEGARYIQRIITPEDILGIAWGGTMYYLIQYLNPCRKTAASFVTLHGSLSCYDCELDVRTLVSRIAMAFGGKYHYLISEGLVASSQSIQMLLQEENIKRIFSLFNKITISASGIGSFYPEANSPLAQRQYLKPQEFEELQELGVYGDLMLRFFNKEGQECNSSLKDRTLAISLECYRRIPCKIVAASGVHKAHTIKAALKGELIDVLLVDYHLARAINN